MGDPSIQKRLMKCALCNRTRESLTKHHVIPKIKGGKGKEIIKVCFTCGKQIHMLFSPAELAKMTLQELVNTPQMKKYLNWIKKQPGEYPAKLSGRLK